MARCKVCPSWGGCSFCCMSTGCDLKQFFHLGAGLVTLLIHWSVEFTVSYGMLLYIATEAEGADTKMTQILLEPGFNNGDDVDSLSWLSMGELELWDDKLQCRPELLLS